MKNVVTIKKMDRRWLLRISSKKFGGITLVGTLSSSGSLAGPSSAVSHVVGD
ncbi:unannotated protein [freshwater metagenome]|uniref:Unannotated protein n=1 Tax=freshwater metagenome TaxID=449393 RepID=A0A6J7UTN0_9ZZZZ